MCLVLLYTTIENHNYVSSFLYTTTENHNVSSFAIHNNRES